MEEKDTLTENKLTYEQLEEVAMQLQNRVMQAEAALQTMNSIAMRLEYLFKVLDKHTHFSAEFVDKCAKEIQDKLDLEKK